MKLAQNVNITRSKANPVSRGMKYREHKGKMRYFLLHKWESECEALA